MARQAYTDAQKAEALDLYVQIGPAEAAQRTGIAKGTLASWAHRAGVKALASETVRAASEQHAADLNARRLRLAADLMGDIERIRTQLWQPCTERKAVVVSDGARDGAHVEIVDIDRDQPTFGEQKQIMTTLAIAVDKVQILTGEATERIEHRHVDALDAELERLEHELQGAQ